MFDAPATRPLADAVTWLSDLLLGSLTVGLCVIAVALVGFAAFTGRMPIRRGARVVLGCFVLLGAPVIAAGLANAWRGEAPSAAPHPALSPPAAPREPLPPASYDPYAGASLRDD